MLGLSRAFNIMPVNRWNITSISGCKNVHYCMCIVLSYSTSFSTSIHFHTWPCSYYVKNKSFSDVQLYMQVYLMLRKITIYYIQVVWPYYYNPVTDIHFSPACVACVDMIMSFSAERANIKTNLNLSVLTVLLLCLSLASINLFTLHGALTPPPEPQPLPKPKWHRLRRRGWEAMRS